MNEAFVTGSQVYGVPHDESDVDLVIRIDKDQYEVLAAFADEEHLHEGITNSNPSLRFGQLNLICCLVDSHFEGWRRGTNTLKSIKPVSRREAIILMSHCCGRNIRESLNEAKE
jgi:hypothetical protein